MAAQVRQLGAAGSEKVFREFASGAKTDRNQLHHALALPGSTPVVDRNVRRERERQESWFNSQLH